MHLSGTQRVDLTLQEGTTTTNQTPTTIRRNRVDSAVQTEMELEASGGVHRAREMQDHGERRYMARHSPSKYYSPDVS